MRLVLAFGGWTLAGCSGAAGRLGFSILLAAFPLACPSALFMLAALQLSAGLAGAAEELCWYAAMIPAGLLPPLLFTLGSLLSRPPKALPALRAARPLRRRTGRGRKAQIPPKPVDNGEKCDRIIQLSEKCRDEAQRDSDGSSEEGPVRALRRAAPQATSPAAREDRDAPSPLPDDMRCPLLGRSGWYRGECMLRP